MNIMLRLKNVKINEKVAEADFYPEGSKSHGHIVVDIAKEDEISCSIVDGYGPAYAAHAKTRLIRIAKERDTRTECVVMWY